MNKSDGGVCMDDKNSRLAEQKYLFHQGRDYRTYELFGAHPVDPEEGTGIRFRVWAPRAAGVSLVGDFNGWDINADPMTRLPDDDTIWEITTDKLGVGWLYKFAVRTDDGKVLMKDRQLLVCDEKELMAKCRESAKKLWSAVNA